MSKNTSITLGTHFDEFIAAQLTSGRYGSASEIVRAGLRLLEDNVTKMQTLRQALTEKTRSLRCEFSGGKNWVGPQFRIINRIVWSDPVFTL